MDFDLTPEQHEWQGRVREFCRRDVIPRAQAVERQETFHWDWVPGLRKLGLLGAIIPKEYGGLGLGMSTFCVILEELGRADAALALTVESHNGLCSSQILHNGNEEQKRRYLPRLASGECLGAWALTEPGSGSDAAGMGTKGVLTGGRWVLNGSKTFTTQGSVGGVYVVFANTGGETPPRSISAFVMERAVPGLSVGKIEHKMGIRSSDTAQLHLHDVTLGPESVVGRVGRAFPDAMRILDAGRVAISGIAVGIARAALEEGVGAVRSNPAAYGIRPDAPGLTGAQRMLAQLAAEIDAARLLTFRAARLLDSGRPYSREASMAKLISGDLAMKAPTEILDLLGPAGGSLDCPVQRSFRDAKLYQIGEGSSQIQQLIISRFLLAEPVPSPAAAPAGAR